MKQILRSVLIGTILLLTLLVMLNKQAVRAIQTSPNEMAAASVAAQSALTVTKIATPTVANVGSVVTYTYLITNSGDDLVENLVATDDRLGPILLSTTSLTVNQVATGVLTHLVDEGDLPGPLTNTVFVSGVVSGTDPVSATALASVLLTSNPALTVDKDATPATATVGDVVTYTYRITNTGDVSLNALSAVDDQLGNVPLTPTTLPPLAAATGQLTYLITAGDLPGPLVNHVVVTGTPVGGLPITEAARATVTLTGGPALAFAKTVAPSTAVEGRTVTYTYRVTNTGQVALTNLTLEDDRLGAMALATPNLAPGDATSALATYTIVAADLPGPLVNHATVTATPPFGPLLNATDAATVTLSSQPALKVTKTVTPELGIFGQPISYTYQITNAGDVTLKEITAEDDRLGPLTLPTTTLAPGQALAVTAPYTFTEADLPGPLTNTVVVTGMTPFGDQVTVSATASAELYAPVRMKLFNIPSLTTARIGETIVYTYQVRNSGDVHLYGLTALDDRFGPVVFEPATLDSRERTLTFFSYQVQESDLPGPLVNTLAVTATTAWGRLLTGTISATVALTSSPGIELSVESSAASVKVSDTVIYSYVVTNIGDVTLSNVTVNDDRLGDVPLTFTTLAPGATTSGQVSYMAVTGDLPGPLLDHVSAQGTPPAGEDVTATALVSVAVEALPPPPDPVFKAWMPLIRR